MPQVLLYAAGAALAAGASSFVVGALLIGGMAMSYQQARKQKQKARDQYNASQVDRLVNSRSTVAPRELAMGRVRKGGTVFFEASTGVNKTTFVQLIALAAHEIDGLEQIFLNDEAVILDIYGNVLSAPYSLTTVATGYAAAVTSVTTLPHTPIAGSVSAHTGTTSGPEGDIAPAPVSVSGNDVTTTAGATITYQYNEVHPRVNIVLVNATGVADPEVQALFPGEWTSAHRAAGVAYLRCRFTYDETAFPTGLPTVTAVIRGAKLYDPRTGLTVWSDNPALMIRHVYQHPDFGKSTVTAAEDVRIAAAANACDTATGYVVNGVTTTVPLYRANTVIPYGQVPKDALDDLAQAMGGSWAFAGGELYLKAGVWSASVLSLYESDLAVIVRNGANESMHPIETVVHRERAQKYNTVNVQIWDAAQEYKQVALPPLVGAALVARDGVTLAQAVSYQAIGFAPQALHVAGIMMRDARDPLTVVLPFKWRAYPVELFDTIDLTLARYGWANKHFQVLGREWAGQGQIKLTLKETAPEIFVRDAAFTVRGYASNSLLPKPWDIPIVGPLNAYSGEDLLIKQSDGTITSRVRVTWPALVDSTITQGGSIEVQYRSVLSSGEWKSVMVSGADQQALLVEVQDRAYYNIRARARHSRGIGVWSSPQITHQVIGKTAPPPAFDTFEVLVQPDGTRQFHFAYADGAAPLDWLGAEIRYVTGIDPAPVWDSMTRLQGLQTHYTSSPVEANLPPAGTYTFACKSVDTSKLRSAYKLFSIMLPPRRLGSVYAEFDERMEGWPGTLTDCHVQDGIIEANDTTTWATAPATWALFTRWNMAPASPIVYQSPTRDLAAVVTGRISPSADADGAQVFEIQTSVDGSTYTAWGAASATFTGRYLRVRLTLTATGPAPVPLIRAFGYEVVAPHIEEYVNDVVISGLTGGYRIGTGDVRAPLTQTFTTITAAYAVIQASGDWSWTLIDKTPTLGPRFQFRLAGVLADPAKVDFYVKGF